MGIKGTVRRNQDGDFIHANVDLDIIITEEVVYIHACTMHARGYVLTCIHGAMCTHAYTHTHMHAHTYTHTHTHAHHILTYMCIHTFIYKQILCTCMVLCIKMFAN